MSDTLARGTCKSLVDPAAPLAFLAGLLAFTSPCCLPLLPAYLGFVSGLGGDGEAKRNRAQLLLGSSMFVAGFAVVFTALGASASLLGSFLLDHRDVLFKVSGAFVIVMGASMFAGAQLPLLSRMVRIDMSRMRRGPGGALPLGMAFAFGWTPCVGPVLAGLLVYAGATGSVGKGAALLFVYSLGLGLPFIATAMLYGRATASWGWLRRHRVWINRAGGAVLIGMGVLLLTGSWTALFAPLLRWYGRLGWPPI